MLLKDINLIIFDLDGVLIDSKRMWLSIHKKVLEEQGYFYSFKEIEPYLGQKTEKVISDLIPVKDKERKRKIKLAKNFADKLSCSKEYFSKVILLPYVKETVRKLKKNYNLAILTNSDRVFVDLILKKSSLKSYFKRVIAADEGFETKEEAILFLVKIFKTKIEKTIYIGDMIRDIKVARNVGCKVISIPGWNPKEILEKEKPDYLINSLRKLVCLKYDEKASDIL